MLKIGNKTIAKEAKICSSVASKAAGLMFSTKIIDKALVFVLDKEEYVPLHMFFVFQTIDVLFLDTKKKIVELKREFRPFTLYSPSKKARYVIELPGNTIKKNKIKVGDKCEFKA